MTFLVIPGLALRRQARREGRGIQVFMSLNGKNWIVRTLLLPTTSLLVAARRR
jgi:hypothetical protein